jgi:hypothetical protein
MLLWLGSDSAESKASPPVDAEVAPVDAKETPPAGDPVRATTPPRQRGGGKGKGGGGEGKGGGKGKGNGPPDGGSDWVSKVYPASGKTYYFNAVTKETQWQPPSETTPKDITPHSIERVLSGKRNGAAAPGGSAPLRTRSGTPSRGVPPALPAVAPVRWPKLAKLI